MSSARGQGGKAEDRGSIFQNYSDKEQADDSFTEYQTVNNRRVEYLQRKLRPASVVWWLNY